jgi:hypothetical protein
MAQMTLADLQKMVSNLDTYGLKPQEVVIEIKFNQVELVIEKSNVTISCDGKIKPKLIFSMNTKSLMEAQR